MKYFTEKNNIKDTENFNSVTVALKNHLRSFDHEAHYSKIKSILGSEDSYLLDDYNPKVPKSYIHQPTPDLINNIWLNTNRNNRVLRNLQSLYANGRLAHTGYLSILPVDQGIEHSAGASFSKNWSYFDAEHIFRLAIEGGCNGIATTLGVLGSLARKYSHQIPMILKLNHNQLLSYPNVYEQINFASVKQAYDMGCAGVGATIYFGSKESPSQIVAVTKAFEKAHDYGMFTVLWCYLRNPAFCVGDVNYEDSADLTAQANHLGVTIGADIIKQKLPTKNYAYPKINEGCKEGYGKFDSEFYDTMASENPIDLTRLQVVHNYMGRIGLINSGGSSGGNDLQDAVKKAVINKRAGGVGLILGRKAFQKDKELGIQILHAVQDVYLCNKISIA